MADQRLFVANYLDGSGEITLSHAQAHYLLHVLRLSEGSPLLVFDGNHGEWRAEIVRAKKAACTIRLIEKVREQTAAQDIHYAFAPLKQGRLDYMVQKAVEMGASLLQPVMTAHTAVSRLNLERMRSNAIEAAEQCGVLNLPEIKTPVKLETLLKTCESGRVIVFCDERAKASPPLETLEKLRGTKGDRAGRSRGRLFGKRTRGVAFHEFCVSHIARAANYARRYRGRGCPVPFERYPGRLARVNRLQ